MGGGLLSIVPPFQLDRIPFFSCADVTDQFPDKRMLQRPLVALTDQVPQVPRIGRRYVRIDITERFFCACFTDTRIPLKPN